MDWSWTLAMWLMPSMRRAQRQRALSEALSAVAEQRAEPVERVECRAGRELVQAVERAADGESAHPRAVGPDRNLALARVKAWLGERELAELNEHLDAVAERLGDFLARQEAMSFAALVAVADAELADREVVVLMALGNRFDFSRGEVQAVVQEVSLELANAIRTELGEAS